jgi:UDP-N-acetylmuramoyl-tripeptide--D-alanyl-D-alanine ligase
VTNTVSTVVLTAAMVARVTGGRLLSGAPGQVFSDVSIDSRSLPGGALFVALRGDRFDGHAFVAAACARGAAGLLVSTPPEANGGVAVIAVTDTLAALQQLARHVRRESGSTVIAITGSAGKTTTKELTADLLSARYRVRRSRGNLNNHIGLPLSLIELRHGPDVAVVELGMNHEGEIRQLVGIAEPDVRVWTNVGDAHIGHFGSREAIARAKAEILEHAGPDACVVANADDPLVMSHVSAYSGRRITFGESADATVRATRVVDRGFDGVTADVTTPAGALSLDVALPGRVHLSNVLAAVAVASDLDVPLSAIEASVAALRPVARRGASSTLPGGARLVDDSYNASPAAVIAALYALARTPGPGRRIAVLGEMLELGAATATLHAECGAIAASTVDTLVVVGGAGADGLESGALAAGLPRDRVYRFADSTAAADAIAKMIAPGDVILVKGSHGTRTDLIADRLLEVA